jgi:hypothetical protein
LVITHLVEREAAGSALLAATRRANESISSFNGWLMAASGAVFSLAIGNADRVAKSVQLQDLKNGAILLLVSLAVGLLAKLVTGMVSAGLGSAEDGKVIGASLSSGAQVDIDVFMSEFAKGLFPPYSWLAMRAMDKAKAGDISAPMRSMAKLSQCSALLVLLQAALVVSAGCVVVHGVGAP